MNETWAPEREWDSQDAFLIGGGPSLAQFDFNLLRGRNVIGCNDAIFLGHGVGHSDSLQDIVTIGLFGDAAWWHRNCRDVHKFTRRIVTNAPSIIKLKLPGILKMRRHRDGIHHGDVLGWNYSTGALAINLAISLGASRIFLLGYDLSNSGGKSHWHSRNPRRTGEGAFKRFIRGFESVRRHLPEGIDVVNVTDGTSRLTCFRKITFDEFQTILNPPQEAAA